MGKQNKSVLMQVSVNIVHIDVIDVSNLEWIVLNTLHLYLYFYISCF